MQFKAQNKTYPGVAKPSQGAAKPLHVGFVLSIAC